MILPITLFHRFCVSEISFRLFLLIHFNRIFNFLFYTYRAYQKLNLFFSFQSYLV